MEDIENKYIIKEFKYGEISLIVNVVYENKTIWLTQYNTSILYKKIGQLSLK